MANSVWIFPGNLTFQGSITFLSPLLAADGSAAAPSYSFSASTGAGIYRQTTSNSVALVANGSQVFLTSDPNLGTRAVVPSFGFTATSNMVSSPAADLILERDAANVLAQKNSTNAQESRIYGTTTGPKYLSLKHDGTNGVIDTAASSGLLSVAPTNATSVTIGKAVTSFNGVATAGFGLSPIVAAPPTSIGAVAAVTNLINYTPPAAAATYCLFGVVNVTAWTTPASFTVVATYKDGSGNARTDTAAVFRGSTGAAAAAVTAVDRWYFGFDAVDVDNSATAITLSTTGTFTGSPVYNFQGTLQRVR